MFDTGYWLLDTGYWMLDTGCWIPDFKKGCFLFDEFVKNRIHQVLGVKFYVLG